MNDDIEMHPAFVALEERHRELLRATVEALPARKRDRAPTMAESALKQATERAEHRARKGRDR